MSNQLARRAGFVALALSLGLIVGASDAWARAGRGGGGHGGGGHGGGFHGGGGGFHGGGGFRGGAMRGFNGGGVRAPMRGFNNVRPNTFVNRQFVNNSNMSRGYGGYRDLSRRSLVDPRPPKPPHPRSMG